MPFEIIRNDITRMEVDAIVNTANPRPIVGTGLDTHIHRQAGPELLVAREKIGAIPRGEARITPAFSLPAKCVIHTVGPVWRGGLFGEERLLRSCYASSLELARKHDCHSIALPLISTGNYRFPKDKALRIVMDVCQDFLLEHEMQIYLVVYDGESFQLSRKLVQGVTDFLMENYVESPPQAQASDTLWERVRQEAARAKPTINEEDEAGWVDLDELIREKTREDETKEEPRLGSPIDIWPWDDTVVDPDTGASIPDGAGDTSSRKIIYDGARAPETSRQEVIYDGARVPETSRQEVIYDGARAPETSQRVAAKGSVSAPRRSETSAPVPKAASAPRRSLLPSRRQIPMTQDPAEDISWLLSHLDAGFSETLLRLIDRTGKKDSEIYTKANITRQHFSKIRNNPAYKPSKSTAIALAIALELDFMQTQDLIGRAGYTLTNSSKFDVIIMYFIRMKNYNIYDINALLFEFDQSLLGA